MTEPRDDILRMAVRGAARLVEACLFWLGLLGGSALAGGLAGMLLSGLLWMAGLSEAEK